MKKLVVSVSNDLVNDQRVKRQLEVWRNTGFDITLIGRKLPHSATADFPWKTIRFSLPFYRGFAFYAFFNLRLFFHLLLHRYDCYLANDLDTLLPNYLVSRLKSKPLIYDSHEFFTGVPEIKNRPLVKFIWLQIERWCLPKADFFITVNDSIARLYRDEYHKDALVIRNLSDAYLPENPRSRTELGLPEDQFILINQGTGINVDRGMEELISALKWMDGCMLLLVGKGDVITQLKQRAVKDGLKDKVRFIDPLPYREMLHYTLAADCGVSLDKKTNINYEYSLPNKVFDFIKCGKPLIASDVTEVSSLLRKYKIGEVIQSHDPVHIAAAVQKLRLNYTTYKEGLIKAAVENSWATEAEKLRRLIEKVKTQIKK